MLDILLSIGGKALEWLYGIFSSRRHATQEAGTRKRDVALVLAAELREFKRVCPRNKEQALGWASGQTYTSAYDQSTTSLAVLGGDLVVTVCARYTKVKQAIGHLDEFKRFQEHTEKQDPVAKRGLQSKWVQRLDSALAACAEALSGMDDVLAKLDAVARV